MNNIKTNNKKIKISEYKKSILIDLFIIAILAIIIFISASLLDLYENITNFFVRFEHFELDELLIVAGCLLFILIFFFIQRLIELKGELVKRKQAEERVEQLNSILRAINKINQLIVKERSKEALIQKACDILVGTRGYHFAWVGLVKKEAFDVVPIARAGFEDGYLEAMRIDWDDAAFSQGPIGMAIKTAKPQVMPDIARDLQYRPWRKESLRRSYMSSLTVPIIKDEKVWGVINLYGIVKNAFDEEEVNLIVDLAGSLSFALYAIETENQRWHTLEALEEAEERFQIVAHNAGDFIWELDSEGCYTYASPASEKILGYTPKEMLGRYFYDFFRLEDQEQLKKIVFQILFERKTFQDFLNRKVHKDGNMIILESSGVPIISKNGTLLGYMGIDRNITERKLAEDRMRIINAELEQKVIVRTAQLEVANKELLEEVGMRRQMQDTLRREQEYFHSIIDNFMDLVLTIDKDKNITYNNNYIERILGYSPQENIGRNIVDFVHPDDLSVVMDVINSVIQNTDALRRIEHYFKHKDGSWRIFQSTYKCILDISGNPTILINAKDIIEYKAMSDKICK